MQKYRDDDFREKPSWRDRDRKRDRSRHVPQDDLGMGSSPAWVRKEILKKAEKLFQGGGAAKQVDPQKQKALAEIHKHFGTDKFTSSVKKYMRLYGLPEDWGTLMLLLDYKDSQVVEEAISALRKLYEKQGLQERQGFRSKLNIIAMTTKDERLRLVAESTYQEL